MIIVTIVNAALVVFIGSTPLFSIGSFPSRRWSVAHRITALRCPGDANHVHYSSASSHGENRVPEHVGALQCGGRCGAARIQGLRHTQTRPGRLAVVALAIRIGA